MEYISTILKRGFVGNLADPAMDRTVMQFRYPTEIKLFTCGRNSKGTHHAYDCPGFLLSYAASVNI
jgi:hypothetical protein